jgi:hypothetical protein
VTCLGLGALLEDRDDPGQVVSLYSEYLETRAVVFNLIVCYSLVVR